VKLLALLPPRRDMAPARHWPLFAALREALSGRFGIELSAVRLSDRQASGSFECDGRRYVVMIFESGAAERCAREGG